MDNYENMLKAICRLCLSQNNGEKMVSLIDNSTKNGLSCFGESVMKITNVYLEKDDKLPKMMCVKCAHLLKQTIYFKLKCETTDKQLKRLVNRTKSSDTSNENIEQVICEYVMFNQYFPPATKSRPSTSKVKLNSIKKEGISIHKIDSKPPDEIVQTTEDSPSKTYDFEDFIDNEDTPNTQNEKPDDYSNEINNILDSMQDIIDTDTKTKPERLKRKIKIEEQYQSLCEYNKIKYSQKQQKETVKNPRNLVCEICNKVLANRFTYNNHMQRHNVCRYICDQCGKGFPKLAEMQMHQLTQHGIGPYLQCDHCPYKAPNKMDLIEHLRLHTGERPFTCEKCGLTFRRRAIYRNHLMCHMEKNIQCTHCPRKFYRQSSMLAHCNNVHKRLYMYMCSICSITYTQTKTVKRHMLVKHGIPREKQGRIKRVAYNS